MSNIELLVLTTLMLLAALAWNIYTKWYFKYTSEDGLYTYGHVKDIIPAKQCIATGEVFLLKGYNGYGRNIEKMVVRNSTARTFRAGE